MIGYLKGRVLHFTSDSVLLDVNGVGYEVYCSGAAYQRLVAQKEGEVYTALQVSENAVTLFGFDSIREKELFLKLTGVSGVGPKSAIGILFQLNAARRSEASASADVNTLSSVKGLGKKTAEKIILELHGKISAAELMGSDGTSAANAPLADETDEDAVAALVGQGLTRNESVAAVKRAKEGGAKSLEDIIRAALGGM